ncbi:restriction endonuclease subunit S [Thiorhodococcus fuscus]|uniref:Restriction endonuclease subunit S n=1 Tax=Thiorhodococcus fuscus TaxID=527200 RepID=A0ABW4Y899_9GAMM
MNQYPRIRLGDLCEKITDGTHHSPANFPQGAFKYITAKNIKPWGLDLTDLTYVDEETHREIFARCDVKRGDILYIKDGATTGVAAINPLDEEFSLLSSVGVLRPGKAVRSKYLLYALQDPETKAKMLDGVAGVAITRLTLRKLNDAEVPVAPLAVQDRIVSKLDELLSDLDAGVAELEAAQKKLAHYRQSLLKAAVEGVLTAEWRAENTPRETGADLLQRILTERRARWEARQLAKFQEQGKPPPKDWQKKYPEPVQPDTSGLPELPEGWVWASLDALIDEGPQNGLYLPGDRYGCGIPILRIDDYQIGWHRMRSELNLVDADASTIALYALQPGDMVINRVNSMTHLGKSLSITVTLDGVLFESNMMRLRFSSEVSLDYVSFYLGSHIGRARLTKDAKWAVNQASINQKDVRRTPIPLPPISEQVTIATMLQAQHGAVTSQATAIKHALQQSAAQRQNILRAAFSGQLVPQDPDDEPANVLLERIRAEREARGAVKKPRGRKAKEPA